MKPGNGRSEGCGRKAKRRGDTLHTAHDAPLEMPDRCRAEVHAAGAQAGAARARDDRPAVQTHSVVSFGPNPTSGQYSQTAGTQRKTSPATATWQTDGNGR